MRTIFLAFLLSVLPFSAASNAAEIAAYVVDYNGGDEAIRIRRGDKVTLSVSVGLPLEAGDVVEVVAGSTSGAAHSVSIDDGNAVRLIDDKSSPFQIREPNLAGLTLGKWRQVMEIISWTARSQTVSAKARGGNSIQSAFLEASQIKLYDGDRTLYLEWTGGIPPFDWEMTNNGASVANGGAWSERKLVLPVKLSPGTAILKLADSGKGTAKLSRSYTLMVLSAPKGETSRQIVSTSTPLQRIATAVELSRLEDGAFIFEAIQQLSTPNATRAETALREALQIGERP